MIKRGLFLLGIFYSFFFIFSSGFFLLFYVLFFALAGLYINKKYIYKDSAGIGPYIQVFIITICVALLALFHVKYFFLQTFEVTNESMLPAIQNGDVILVEKFTMGFIMNFYEQSASVKRLHLSKAYGFPFNWQRPLKKNDIIVFFKPVTREVLVKRIHEIKNGKYCVLGDNLEHSLDSRSFGCISENRIIGRYVEKLFPQQEKPYE